MSVSHYVSIGIVLVLLGAQQLLRPLVVRYCRLIYFATLCLLAGAVVYEVHSAFIQTIRSPIPIRYYAPPYQSISFFLLSSWSRLIGPYAFSIATSLLILWALKKLGRYQERFEAGEQYLIAISVAVLRHPFWLVFVGLALLTYLVSTGIITLKQRGHPRVSFYYLWLPLTLLTLISTPLLIQVSPLAIISFANLH